MYIKGKHLITFFTATSPTCSCFTATDLIKLAWMLSTLQCHSSLL